MDVTIIMKIAIPAGVVTVISYSVTLLWQCSFSSYLIYIKHGKKYVRSIIMLNLRGFMTLFCIIVLLYVLSNLVGFFFAV